MSERLGFAASGEQPTAATAASQPNVFHEAFNEVPTAVGDLVRGIKDHPVQFGEHAALTVGTSAIASFALSYVLPARSPFGLVLGAGMMIPTIVSVGKSLWRAHELASKPGANTEEIGHQLADQAVSGGVDLGLNFMGGWAGAEGAYKLNASDTAAGQWSRETRSWIADKETGAYANIKGVAGRISDLLHSATPPAGAAALAEGHSLLASTTNDTAGSALPEAPQGYSQKFGNFHSHSSFSDGDGTPDELYANAKKAGYDFWDISEHNHDGARLGVEAGSERAGAEANLPILAQDPAEWQQIKTSADNATVPGQFQAGVAEEMGVLGKDPPKVGSDGSPLPGGANHTILRNFDQTFVRTDRPQHSANFLDRLTKPIMHLIGRDVPDSVADIPDGKFDLLAKYLNANEDPNNPAQAIGAHPRWLQDTSAATPANLRLHDYGINEMGGVDKWADGYGSKHFVGLEVMKGEALNPGPVDTLKPQDVDLTSYNGYLDLFGDKVKAAPYTGLDTHFKARIGNPDAATGLLVNKLDDAGITDAVAGRRSIATSSMSKVSGYMAADDGKFLMGQTVDTSAIPDGITPQVRINGAVTPDASYKANLWFDNKLGDGNLAKIVQTKSISGADLLKAGQTVAFDPIKPAVNSPAAFYVEVQRTDGASPKYGDVLGTWAPSSDGSVSHVNPLKNVLGNPTEGPNGGTVMEPQDLSSDPLVAKEYAVDPNTPFPQRMITSPIWMEPKGASTAHLSPWLSGLAGTVASWLHQPATATAH